MELPRRTRGDELLKPGEFRNEAGYLGLEQDLPADASATVFFIADLKSALERFGNRGYRAAQLEAHFDAIAAGHVAPYSFSTSRAGRCTAASCWGRYN